MKRPWDFYRPCEGFSFLFVLQILFVREGNTLFLFVTEGGLISALKLVLRFMTACVPLALMLAVTRTNDLAMPW